MDLICKISFDIKYMTLHEVVDWLVQNNFNTPSKFNFNNHFYIFEYLNKDDDKYIGYKTKLKLFDKDKNIIISYLIPPNNSIHII